MNYRPAVGIVSLATLLLAAGNAAALERFTVSADGQEVTDAQTSLVWRRCAEGMKWDGKTCMGKAMTLKLSAAKERTAATAKSEDKSWRIPSKDELKGIVVKSKKNPAIDVFLFPNTPAALFWALRPGFKDNLNAWVVDFNKGKVYGNTRQGKFHVRLVRASP